jgi:hypothetical protein
MKEDHNNIYNNVDKIYENIQPGPRSLDPISVDESRKCKVPRDQNGVGLNPANYSGSSLD